VPDDVEALFRINGLSTFTLGFCQVACLLLGSSDGILGLGDILVQVGMITQGINVIITTIYFATPVSGSMKAVTKTEAMLYNNRESLQREYTRFIDAVKQHAQRRDEQSEVVLKQFHDNANTEIEQLAHVENLDLDIFSMQQKFWIRRNLRIKEINEFTHMAAF